MRSSLLVGACGLVLAGCAGGPAASPAAGAGSPAVSTPASVPAEDAPVAGPVPVPAVGGAPVAAGERPVRLVVPAIGVDTSLTDLGIAADGSLEVPTDYAQAGWLDRGPAPGARGPAVLAGHVDSKAGPAVFYRLRELVAGDEVDVTRADGTVVQFRVDGVQQYGKDAFPTASVYGPVPGPVLRLITCGGTFDRSTGHYRENVVAYATEVGA